MRTLNFRCLAAVLALAPLGCSAQADPDYRGEPVATIRGRVVTGDHPPNQDMEAALVWTRPEPGLPENAFVVGRQRVSGGFPADFTLDVLEPPPRLYGEHEVSVNGFIAAIPAQTSRVFDRYSFLGVADTAAVVYFWEGSKSPDDAVAVQAAELKVPPVKGYHLYRREITRESEAAAYRCHFDDLCEYQIFSAQNHPPSELAVWQAHMDDSLARCLEHIPGARTCTYYELPSTPEEQAQTDACVALVDERFSRQSREGKTYCPAPWTDVENPEGFEHRVTVTLGRDSWTQSNPASTSDRTC